MVLPADFSKIYGSTATGGLTPISDVNYAKGWEFVGANPPTKNDFSYLQNLSDQKSKWLYDNNLGRLIAVKTFNSSGTYTPTAGTKSILVQVQGGGGAGGNATSGTGTSATVGTGGGAGGFAVSYLTTVPSSASVVVGSGGVSSSGGNSSFDGTIIANGGAVGANNAISGGASFTGHARSGIGGTATGGNLYNSKGGAGSPAIITQGIPSGGNGGASQLSGSELGGGASGAAGSTGLLGAGGSGASQPTGVGGFGGGAGGAGLVIVWEYS